MMKDGCRRPSLCSPLFSRLLPVAPAFVGSCKLHDAGDDGNTSFTASHAGLEGCMVMHRDSRRSGLRRVDFRSGEGMLGIVWVVRVKWCGCAHVGRRHEI